MKYETISQLLREMTTCGLSESILKDIQLIEEINLRIAYGAGWAQGVQFEDWYKANFKQETK